MSICIHKAFTPCPYVSIRQPTAETLLLTLRLCEKTAQQGGARSASATRAARMPTPIHLIVLTRTHTHTHDHAHTCVAVGDVKPPGNEVRHHQDAQAVTAQVVQDVGALDLGHLSVQRGHLKGPRRRRCLCSPGCAFSTGWAAVPVLTRLCLCLLAAAVQVKSRLEWRGRGCGCGKHLNSRGCHLGTAWIENAWDCSA